MTRAQFANRNTTTTNTNMNEHLQALKGWFNMMMANRIVKGFCIALFVIAVMYITFLCALSLMGYYTYAVVGGLSGWASVVGFVAACIPGVNALALVVGFAGWIAAVICQQAMQAIVVTAAYYAISAGVIAYIAAYFVRRKLEA